MLQMSDIVGAFMKGSVTALAGAGTTSMSLAWIGAQPRMEDPSKPRPSSKTASVSSARGMVKCCQRPMKSMNFRSTITAFLSCAYPSTSFALGILVGPLMRQLRRVMHALRLQSADRCEQNGLHSAKHGSLRSEG